MLFIFVFGKNIYILFLISIIEHLIQIAIQKSYPQNFFETIFLCFNFNQLLCMFMHTSRLAKYFQKNKNKKIFIFLQLKNQEKYFLFLFFYLIFFDMFFSKSKNLFLLIFYFCKSIFLFCLRNKLQLGLLLGQKMSFLSS